MRRQLALMGLVMGLAMGAPVMAQDTNPPPNCPVFQGEADGIRTSYYMGEGLAYFNAGQYNNAALSFSCIVRVIDDTYVPAYMSRASTYMRQRDYQRAMEDYTRAIELDGELIAAINNRGVVQAALQEYEAAAEDFDRAIEVDPDFIAAYNNRSILYALAGEYEQAITLLEDGIARSGIDRVLTQYRDPNRAADAQAIPFDPIHANAYALLGIMYSAQALEQYNDYLFLSNQQNGFFPDERIQSAAGALESRFNFEMRLDDGTWMLVARYDATAGQ